MRHSVFMDRMAIRGRKECRFLLDGRSGSRRRWMGRTRVLLDACGVGLTETEHKGKPTRLTAHGMEGGGKFIFCEDGNDESSPLPHRLMRAAAAQARAMRELI